MNWINKLDWAQKTKFESMELRDYKNDEGMSIGLFKELNGLKFVILKDAGHYVSMDQSKNALQMVNQFVDELSDL